MHTLADRMFDAMVTREPYASQPTPPSPGEEGWPRCQCGAWLKFRPDPKLASDHALIGYCDGTNLPGLASECGAFVGSHWPHAFVLHAWGIQRRVCTRCHHTNEEVEV